MEWKATSGIMLILLLTSMLSLAFNTQPVKASGTIYIRADGSVDPSNAPIQRDGDIYTFTADIYDSIEVEKDNVIVNGDGYTLQGVGTGNGLTLYGRTNVTIQSVRIVQFYAGISLVSSTNNMITENTVNSNTHGIHLLQSTRNTVSNNTLTSNQGGIIVYQGSDHTTVENNTVDSNGFGIDVGMANWCTVTRNSITNNAYGIYLDHSSDNTISENTIIDNSSVGIELYVSSNNNTISTNNITNNGLYGGISLYYSLKNTINANTITGNSNGIRLSDSSDNEIYHNSLKANTYQVNINGYSLNVWDDGYPSGGNYWSDYVERYPDAKELDDSRIWNSPYVIDENNKDNYPLMEPWSSTPETVTVSVLIDYGNGTRRLHQNVMLARSSSVLNATLAVSRVNYTSWGELGIFVDAINNVWNNPPYVWIWWNWDSNESMWMLGPLASNQYILSNGDLIAWYYENTEYWPLLPPPWTPTPPIVAASIDIDPDTLNLKSKGKWITAYVQLPEEYKAADINASAILLNGTIAPILDCKYGFVTNPNEYLIDHNGDGILERMVKFDRATVESWIYHSQGIQRGNVALTITGELFDGTILEGSNTIFVDYAGDANNDGTINVVDFAVISAHWYPGPPTGQLGYEVSVDFNKDGKIDIIDVATISANWGLTVPPKTS